MNHPVIALISRMVQEGDPTKAESALVAVADEEGDFALMQVLEAMPARDLVAILREHDASHPSIAGELVTPASFVKVLAMEAKYTDVTHEALRGMMNMVIFRGDEPDAFLEAMGNSEHGILAFADYFSDYHDEVESFFQHGSFDFLDSDPIELSADDSDLEESEMGSEYRQPSDSLQEIRDQDWRELAWRLRCEHYGVFTEVLKTLRGRARSEAARLDGLGDGKGKPRKASGGDKEESFL